MLLYGYTRERFISYTNCAELNAEAIFTYITSALRETDADITNCVSQCDDGASVMSGYLTGVRQEWLMSILLPSTSIVLLTSLILFSLILVALFLMLQTSLYLRVYMLLSHHLSLTPYSWVNRKSWDKREIQIKKLSDTRWYCLHFFINAIITTIWPLLHTLEEISDSRNARLIKARGLLFQVESFSFFLSLVLFDHVFAITSLTYCSVSRLVIVQQLPASKLLELPS